METNLAFLGGLRFILNGMFEKSEDPEALRSKFIEFLSVERKATGVLLDRAVVFENKDQFFAKCWKMHCSFQFHGIYEDLEGDVSLGDLNRWIHFLVAFGFEVSEDNEHLDAVFEVFEELRQFIETV